MIKYLSKTGLTFLCIFSVTFIIRAQDIQSITQGVSAKVFGKYENVRSNSFFLGDVAESEPNGRGYGLQVGYGITPSIEVFASYEHTNFNLSKSWEVLRLENFTFGGQYNFGASRKQIRPYLGAAFSTNNLKVADVFIREGEVLVYDNAEMILKGLSGNFGGGLRYFPIPELAIDLGVDARFGKFNTITVNTDNYQQDENIDFRFLLLKLGVVYFFF